MRALRGRPDLPPDEERARREEDDQRDPGVEAQTEEVPGRVDPQQLFEEAPEGVVGDVEREERRRAEADPPIEPQQEPDAAQIPQELVQERRVVGQVAVELPRSLSRSGQWL